MTVYDEIKASDEKDPREQQGEDRDDETYDERRRRVVRYNKAWEEHVVYP
jgi:hypothetical protein